MNPTLIRVAEWAGRPLSPEASRLLARYGEWLVTEALPAGGIGPGEAEIVTSRHLGDSLSFARAWRDRDQGPASIVDLGSGVGLPGIPLAIAHPEAAVTLVDRSGRRVGLMERARRVLALDNVEIVQTGMEAPVARFEAVVARAAAPPDRLATLAPPWAAPGAPIVVGGSTRSRPEVVGWNAVEVPAEVLDPGGWLLIMVPPLERS